MKVTSGHHLVRSMTQNEVKDHNKETPMYNYVVGMSNHVLKKNSHYLHTKFYVTS